MKYIVVGDLHGSINAAKKVHQKVMNKEVDGVLLLGDILYHGPRNPIPTDYNPGEVSSLLNEIKNRVIAVCGNCDSEVDQMVLEFPIGSVVNQLFLGNRKVLMTHGHRMDDNMEYLEEGDILITGHTHIVKADLEKGIYHLNAGSLTFPKQDNPKTYGILEETGFSIYTMEDECIKTLKFDQ